MIVEEPDYGSLPDGYLIIKFRRTPPNGPEADEPMFLTPAAWIKSRPRQSAGPKWTYDPKGARVFPIKAAAETVALQIWELCEVATVAYGYGCKHAYDDACVQYDLDAAME